MERRQFRSAFDAVQSGVVLVPGDRLRALLPDLSIRQTLLYHSSAEFESGLASRVMRMKKWQERN